jgi:signal transduction histidine kinase
MDDIGPWILASRGLDPVRAAGILEIERKRIAADLHDSTSQHLSAIGLHLMALQRHGHFEGKSLAIVTEIQRSLEAAQKELRSISYVMYPLDLQREGFVSTLRRFSEGFSCRTGMDTNLQIEPCADGLPLDVQGALLRIIQEAMANAYRHSGAGRLVVHVAIKRGAAIACVIDDGRGMPRENRQIKPTTGVGIAAMAARAERLGGHLRIRSAPGGGTRVSALVPVMIGPPQIVRLSGPIYRGTPSRI